MSMKLARQRARRGSVYLDGKRPGWWREVDEDSLDLASSCKCVLGQVGAIMMQEAGDDNLSYATDGFTYLLVDWFFDDEAEASLFGFETEDKEAIDDGLDYDELTVAWKELIIDRKGPKPAEAEAVTV